MASDPSNAERLRVVLPAIADLTVAADLKQSFIEALDSGRGIEVNAGEVQNITSPCWQILVAAAKTFREGGVETLFAVTSASPAFREAAETLGIQQALGLKEEVL